MRHAPLASFVICLSCGSQGGPPAPTAMVVGAAEKVKAAMLQPDRPAVLEAALAGLVAAERTWLIAANRQDPAGSLAAGAWLSRALAKFPEVDAPVQGELPPTTDRLLLHARISATEAQEELALCYDQDAPEAEPALLDRCTTDLIELQVGQLRWTALAARFLDPPERERLVQGPEVSAWLFLPPGPRPSEPTGG